MITAMLLSYMTLVGVLAGAQARDGATNQIIQVPPGWSRADFGQGTVLTPDAAKDSAQVVLQGYAPFRGDLGARFQELLKPLEGQRILKAAPIKNLRSMQGADMLAEIAEVRLADGSDSYRFYVAASTPGRLEMLLFVATSRQAFDRYAQDVQQLVATRQFANLSRAPANGGTGPSGVNAPQAGAGSAAGADRLEGVYSGFKFNLTAAPGGALQTRARNDFFTFFANGTVYNGLPDHGLVGFNLARECGGGKQDFCGVYRVDGGQIAIVLNGGTYRQVGTFTPPGHIEISDRSYVLQGDPAKTPSHTLEGVFVRADAQPGEDLARRFIQFTRDGRFQDQGLVTTVAGTDLTGGNLHFERERGVGTYQLMNFTLILRYSDGYVRGLPILIRPEDQNHEFPSAILVNTYALVRRG